MAAMQVKEDAFCRMLEETEEFMGLREDLTTALKKGFFELAQAKYSMGQGKVSQLQYNMEMEATTRVECSNVGEGIGEMALTCSEASPAKRLDQASESESNQPGNKKIPAEDPISWFGVMVSPHLREAQATFTEVLPTVIGLANAIKRMQTQIEAMNEAS